MIILMISYLPVVGSGSDKSQVPGSSCSHCRCHWLADQDKDTGTAVKASNLDCDGHWPSRGTVLNNHS